MHIRFFLNKLTIQEKEYNESNMPICCFLKKPYDSLKSFLMVLFRKIKDSIINDHKDLSTSILLVTGNEYKIFEHLSCYKTDMLSSDNKTKYLCKKKVTYFDINNLTSLTQALKNIAESIKSSLNCNLPVILYFDSGCDLNTLIDFIKRKPTNVHTALEDQIKKLRFALFLRSFGTGTTIFDL
ncbi:hypothetical protein COBT_004156, partial [Conglomerata obtusa]